MKNTNPGPAFAIATLGCKVNKAESIQIQNDLRSHGWHEVPFTNQADVYIINTCTVTAKSDFQSRQLVRRALHRNPSARIMLIGCYAQTNPQVFADLPPGSLILGNRDKGKLAEILTSSANIPNPPSCGATDYTRAFLKIQDGCNGSCTYCVVPTARGQSFSQEADKVLNQARQMIASGYKEIVLTGIHIGYYGLDLVPPIDFVRLLEQLCALPGLGRLRISSLEPTEFSPKLLTLLSGNDKICPHFHIPLQSADDRILQAMERNYSFARYQELLLKLHEMFPCAAKGADVIVGFPGEDEQAFADTYQRIEKLPLNYLHVFSYSRRPHTKAAHFLQQIPGKIKKQRSEILRHLGHEKRQRFYQSQTGSIRPALILKQQRDDNYLLGLTDNYLKIAVIGGEKELINQIVPVEIVKIEGVGAGFPRLFGTVSTNYTKGEETSPLPIP
ncbi:MAG: tRNA (N(6)-L-threonylcarbamoyladenosine(37)-C(2))-methylthiotransferase MtaB [Candidatus Schekmanbacteria bacterium]|nr:tRNA (N(6)-L-threonylcarbamoyladenosine(37)-C(2))-methylthiotransferase MtaB [Candidatus Schekmanbacteria bacterium]